MMTQSETFKTQGNLLLKENKFEDALLAYTKAIELGSRDTGVSKTSLAIFYSNRALTHIKLESYGLALDDGKKAVQLDANYDKAYLRVAFSSEIRQQYREAFGAYKKAFELTGSKDEFLYNKMLSCKSLNDEEYKRKKLALFEDTQKREEVVKVISNQVDWKKIEAPEAAYQGQHISCQTLDTPQALPSDWVIQLMESFKDQKPLHAKYTLQLIERCKDILKELHTCVQVELPQGKGINICGDIHGQYYDMFNIMQLHGYPNSTNNQYLFNGDFVDRGSFSVECMLTLIAWKVSDPNCIHMVRGNHEAKQVNSMYGFKGEVQAKYKNYGKAVYEAFSDLFCALPLCYVLNKSIFITHGGLPANDKCTIEDIKAVNRFCQPPERGIMCDLLWADPSQSMGYTPSKRGVSHGFGADITERFLQRNGLKTVIRSHEVKQEGYEVAHGGKCVTIFSAPNYCDFTGNKAAVIRAAGPQLLLEYKQFTYVPHPNIGPMAYTSQFSRMC